MTILDCKNICLAAMTMGDGYASGLSADQIKAHLADCVNCHREVQQLRSLHSLLDSQKRRQPTENVWKHIEQRFPDVLPAQSGSQSWYPFMFLGLLLLGYRLFEIVPDRHFGFLYKLVPVLFVIAAFSYLKQNPFKINSELRLEGE